MKRQMAQKKTAGKPGLRGFISKHPSLAMVIVSVLVIGLLLGVWKYITYTSKFSDRDYAAIEAAAETTLSSTGTEDIKKFKECYYAAPEKYSSVRLYCNMEMIGYIGYGNDEQAISVARSFDEEIKKLGKTRSDIPEVYQNPADSYAWATVKLAAPLPDKACTFTIATGERAGRIANFLPHRTDPNLIALKFTCSAESREEYFPVTYRQGE